MIKELVNSLEYISGDITSIINSFEILRLLLEDNNLLDERNIALVSKEEKITKMIIEYIDLNGSDKSDDQFISKLISCYKRNNKEDENLILLRNRTDKNIALLVEKNMPLVRKIAGRYARDDFEFEELCSVGSLGLLHAIRNFEIEKNFKFSTFAFKCIKGYIIREIHTSRRTIRLSSGLPAKISKYKEFYDDYYKLHGFYPSDELVCDYLEIDIEDLNEIRFAMKEPTSLNGTIDEEESSELLDFIPDETCNVIETVEDNELNRKLKEVFRVGVFNDIERYCLIHKFGAFGNDELYFAEIGRKFGVTTEYVRQSYYKAIKKFIDCPLTKDIAEMIGIDVSKRPDIGRGRFKKSIIESIYDKFPNFSREDVLIAISKLPEDLLYAIKKRYGEDFESYCDSKDWDSSLNYKLSNAHELLLKFLYNPNFRYRRGAPGKKDLFQRLEIYDPKLVLLAVKSLSPEYIEALAMRYGEDYIQVIDTTTEVCNKVNSNIIPTIKRKLLKYSKLNDVWDRIFSTNYNLDFEQLLFLVNDESFINYVNTLQVGDRKLIKYTLEHMELDSNLVNRCDAFEAIKCILFGYKLYLKKNGCEEELNKYEDNIKILVMKSL